MAKLTKSQKQYRSIQSKVKRFNINVDKIKDVFDVAPSQSYEMMSKHARVIYSSAYSNRGKIRTYKETIDFMKKTEAGRERLAKNPYTKAEYTKEVKKVLDTLGKRTTLRGETSYQRIKMILQLDTYRTLDKYNFDLSKKDYKTLSTDELLEAFRNAEARERVLRETKTWDSTNPNDGWTVLLQEEIEKILNMKELFGELD